MNQDVIDRLRGVLRDHGRLPTDVDALAPEADLYEAGMTSHASVNVMLGVEDAFDVEFPAALRAREGPNHPDKSPTSRRRPTIVLRINLGRA